MKDVTFTIVATMPEDWADYFCSFIKCLENYGHHGHSNPVVFYADGDGDFRPKFKIDHNYKHCPPREKSYNTILETYDRG